MNAVDVALECIDSSFTRESIAGVLAAEVRHLRKENERQRFDILAMNQSLDLLRKDAERYRWLRDSVRAAGGITKAQTYFWNCGGSRRRLDAAIDAARGVK